MQLKAILKIIGLLLMLFSTTMLTPLLVDQIYQEGDSLPFLYGFALTFATGLVLWLPLRNYRKELRLRDGFIVVVLFWTVLGLAGAIPFVFTLQPYMSFTDAAFESISGLTTTGATVLTGLDDMPHAMLFYRQQLQWLGGMGIIVLAVALMPMLGIGGMSLYRAETPGPMKDTKLTPRLTETAKALWYIYLSLTIACALAYWLGGMELFDAISHSFATVSIGGFSPHDASIGYFNSPLIEMIAVVFMLLAGVNFALHFIAWRSFNLLTYWRDSEFKTYLLILAIVSAITVVYLYLSDTYIYEWNALHHGLFQAVSIGTTTGFTTAEYHFWPGFLPVMLLFASFVGGCAGSTGGGMKVVRFLLLLKQGRREILRLIHPTAVIPIRMGDKVLPTGVIESVWGFFAAYVGVFSVMLLVLMMTGLDQITAFSAVAASLNNLGPGLGQVGANYASIPDTAKWVLSFGMIMGRLEIFTLLVILSPAFWRR
ncbi:MAG: potassium transporter [Gammaproteobacteria bacterium]|nr:potassium transporter [Gammaproteobacteria bacterium]